MVRMSNGEGREKMDLIWSQIWAAMAAASVEAGLLILCVLIIDTSGLSYLMLLGGGYYFVFDF